LRALGQIGQGIADGIDVFDFHDAGSLVGEVAGF